MKLTTTLKTAIWAVPVTLVIVIIIFACSTFSLQDPPLATYGVSEYNTGWVQVSSAGNKVVDELPASLTSERNTAVINNVLPARIGRNTVLGVKTTYQKLRAYVDGTEIYEIGYKDKAPFGKVYGYIWSFIPIPVEYAGKTVTLEYTSPFNINSMDIDGIRIGHEGAFIISLFKDNVFTIFMFILLLILSSFFFIITLMLRKNYPQEMWRSNIYLALFSLFTALWLFSDSDITQFISEGRTFFYLLSFFSFMLVPVPALLFFNELCNHRYKAVNILCGLCLANIVICSLLYLFNVYDLIQTIYSTHVLVVLSIIFIVFLSVREIRQKNSEIRVIAFGISFLIICSLLSFAQYYLIAENYSTFFSYGLLVFFIFVSISAMKKVLSLVNASIQASTYKMLAYTDSLTGLGNRMAFSEAVDTIQKEKASHSSISLVVFDMDNLKPINDALGHMTGDELIRGVSDCLNAVFTDIGKCYRIGGDEFAVVITDKSEQDVTEKLKNLHNLIEEYNKKHYGKIALSKGFEHCGEEDIRKLSVYDIFDRADAKMYEHKKSKGLSAIRNQ